MQTEEPLGVHQPEVARDERAVVRSVDAVLVVPEPAHERVVGLRHAGGGPAAVHDGVRESVAGRIRDHEVEVGEVLDHLQVVDGRPRVGVREQERRGAGLSERTWMKWMGWPSISVMKCGTELMRASSARQSKPCHCFTVSAR